MNKRLIVLQSPIGTASGYGERSRDIARAMISAKGQEWDIRLIPTPWGSTPQNALHEVRDKDLIDRMSDGNVDRQPDLFIQVTVANEFTPLGKKNIGITAGIETNLCAPQWIEGINRMDLVLASSKHSTDVLSQSSFATQMPNGAPGPELKAVKPVLTLMEGLDENVYHKTAKIDDSILDIMQDIPETFGYLFVGHWLNGEFGQDRKDVGGAIFSFLHAFKGRTNPPFLLLKTSIGSYSITSRDLLLKKIESVKSHKDFKGYVLPNIYVVYGDLEPSEMNSLYNHPKIKAMVSLTKGEGFGRPLLEFAATGKPVIASNYSGHLDFLKPEFSILVGGSIGPVHPSVVWDGMIIQESSWFTANYQEASSVMADMYQDYDKYKSKTKDSIPWIKKHMTFDIMQTTLIDHLEDMLSQIPQEVQMKLPEIKLPKLKKMVSE